MASGGNAVAGVRPADDSPTASASTPALTRPLQTISSARTRSIWLAQLVLAATTIAIAILVLVMQPAMFAAWTFSTGIAAILILTVVTLAAPWHRVPRAVTLLVPFGDIVAIGLLANDADLRLSFLWTFPIVWIANHFRALWLAGALVLIGAILVAASSVVLSTASVLRFTVVLVAMSFIGITLHINARRSRAFKKLLRRQANRLRTSLGRVQAQERRTGEIVAMATHELRNPLSVVLGRAELALQRSDLPDEVRTDLEHIYAASERMLTVTSEFLGSSRSAITQPRDLAPVDVRQILDESIASSETSARSAHVQLVSSLERPLPARADAFRLRQVFDNLIGNAIKYTPAGGSVVISADSTDDSLTVRVADSGIGIDAPDLARVFDPYFRAERAQEVAEGTGLGLGICREIIESHGGELTITSDTSGGGTTVTVMLPAGDAG